MSSADGVISSYFNAYRAGNPGPSPSQSGRQHSPGPRMQRLSRSSAPTVSPAKPQPKMVFTVRMHSCKHGYVLQ
eukprot:1159873-Pelagomonas_calceolata.AAC.7